MSSRRKRMGPPLLVLTREPTKQDDADLVTYHETARMIQRLIDRLDVAMEEDVKVMRWLHKRIVAVERDAQKRDVEQEPA